MKLRGFDIAALSALAFIAGTVVARAEPVGANVYLVSSDFSGQSQGSGPATARRTLEWDAAKGRWGLSFGVEAHSADRDVELKDVSPGVYYRLTRRLHIGGAVSLAPDQAETLRMGQPQYPAPRVRLETTFKF